MGHTWIRTLGIWDEDQWYKCSNCETKAYYNYKKEMIVVLDDETLTCNEILMKNVLK